MNGPVVIDTPEQIERFRVACIIMALRTEVRTGMKMSRVSALHAAQTYGIPARTKKAALEQMLAFYEEKYGEPFGAR